MAPETEAEYTAYVERAWPTLVRTAVFLGAAPHEAEDLAQATLVRCYTAWERVAGADNPDGYVYRMLLNALRDSRRTRWWRDRASTGGTIDGHSPVDDGPVPDARPAPDEAIAMADAVHRALGALSMPNRTVVVLRYFVQLSERQTADVLGIAPGTVKSRLSRSLARLAESDHLLDLTGGSR